MKLTGILIAALGLLAASVAIDFASGVLSRMVDFLTVGGAVMLALKWHGARIAKVSTENAELRIENAKLRSAQTAAFVGRQPETVLPLRRSQAR